VKNIYNFIFCVILFTAFNFHLKSQSPDSLRKEKALQLMKKAQEEYVKIKDYQARIINTERVDGKTLETEYILTKYLRQGLIYLVWQPGPYEGMQAVYNPSVDKHNTFRAKETGLRGIVGIKSWNNSDKVIKMMYPHNFTIHQTSLAYFFETMQAIVKKGLAMNKLTVVSIDEVADNLTKRPATSVLVKLSSNPKDGLMWSKVQLFFDKEHKLPLHFILYDFSGNKLADSAFTNFRKNTGLTVKDFEIAD
jgi:outer membrane lipoprotein-sorting protein